jgi:phenylacetate-coenzyme A ligase PaaK-like adenylate-forming protein
MVTQATKTEDAARELDAHLRETIAWHFSEETGCPFWLDWLKEADWDPRVEVKGAADLLRFPHFEDTWLRKLPHERWIPRAYAGKPFTIFETGGTTGMPKQRIGWDDYKVDYADFSETLSDEAFPKGSYWLMVGPTGPRRLRLAIEYLCNLRGGSCYFVDLDPRWVKKLIKRGDPQEAQAYMDHAVDQAMTILRHREVSVLFTTPRLLEAMSERRSLPEAGIKGVFCGGTTMSPQTVRFLVEEVLESRATLVPTYGNTLMGLAASRPLDTTYSVTYHAPQPRALLRVVNPENTAELVPYDSWGRVELTTLTRELFMPRFLERDEARRREPCELFPWDGVAEVRPFSKDKDAIVEGVY